MAPSRKIYAIKRIRLEGRDTETAMGFIDEIRLLTRLRNQPNIIQLVDAEVSKAEAGMTSSRLSRRDKLDALPAADLPGAPEQACSCLMVYLMSFVMAASMGN